MRFSLPHALTLGAVIGLASGCATGNTNTNREPAAPPPAQPMVTAEDMERSGGEPIEKTLQAKVPGLIVSRTSDGYISVQIRGPSSFYSSNRPLYVVDESPMEAGAGGVLAGINPHDIESIRVLKDPAELGIYGMRGANGVILITTKRPGGGKKAPDQDLK
jgi:TonB-dependent SusC/RagA subfamily outer membrane receptor